jgi:hypothetical protein
MVGQYNFPWAYSNHSKGILSNSLRKQYHMGECWKNLMLALFSQFERLIILIHLKNSNLFLSTCSTFTRLLQR